MSGGACIEDPTSSQPAYAGDLVLQTMMAVPSPNRRFKFQIINLMVLNRKNGCVNITFCGHTGAYLLDNPKYRRIKLCTLANEAYVLTHAILSKLTCARLKTHALTIMACVIKIPTDDQGVRKEAYIQ